MNRRKALISSLGLTTALTGGIAKAELPNLPEQLEAQRVSVSFSGNKDNKLRTTLAAGEEGIYEGDVSNNGQFAEKLRLYSDVETQDSKTKHTVSGGFVHKPLSLGKAEQNFYPYMALGETQGLGLESRTRLGPWEATLNSSHRFEQTHANHAGASLRVDIPYLHGASLGAGFDRVDEKAGKTKQTLVNTTLKPTKHTALGLAYVEKENPDGSKDKTFSGFHTRTGSQPGIGWRARGTYTENAQQNTRAYDGEVIVTRRDFVNGFLGSEWAVERNVENAGLFTRSAIPISRHGVESIFLPDRTKHNGPTLMLKGRKQEQDGESSGFVTGAGAYKLTVQSGNQYGFSLAGTHEFSDSAKDITSLEPGLLYRGKDTTLKTSLKAQLNGSGRKPTFGIEVQRKF